MSVDWVALRKRAFVAGCLVLALQIGFAQSAPITRSVESARAVLVQQARILEARGRPDMAVQLWQQILLSDPSNVDALAGLARDYKLIGSADKSNQALERLRGVSPHDPNIAKIEALTSTKAETSQLQQAGELARQGRTDDAMRIYRQLYGDHPPDGDIGLAYYQTLYGTASGKEEAVEGMRAMADRNPGDPRFAIALGTMLTYDARTRADGIRILQEHSNDPNAQIALRQALIWDSANPTSAAELRDYLKAHPADTQIAGALKQNEVKLAQMNSGIARTPAERAAFAALNAHHLDEAEKLFNALLDQDPKNGRVAAGMGFLRMQQKNFGAAISYLTQAVQDGYNSAVVRQALTTSRFWYTMGEASQAFAANQMNLAAIKYRDALSINPRSPEALNGLAGLLVRQEQYPAAAGVYEQLIHVQPGNLDGWRGLFLAYAQDGQNQKALALSSRFPGSVKVALNRDPEYLRTLATIYQAQGRGADAQRALSLALSLPFPDNGTTLQADTKLQYAGILMDAKRYDQAAALYVQMLNYDPGNLSAWMGLVGAHHLMGQDTQAIADVQKMPPATYEAALADPGFLTMLGGIYQQANQYEIAQGFLERAIKMQMAAGGQPTVALQLQLASIYLQRNNSDQAFAIYHQVLVANPDNADAWKGLISTLLATNRNAQALQELAQIPAPVRKELESDISFVQTEASLYAATGDTQHAVQYMNRVQTYYAKLKEQPPADIAVQNAWLLYNTGNDRGLYSALMNLGGRADLTMTQRETVQTIWANWSVRRAATAMENDNIQRAVDILDAAYQAFPNNLAVRKAVAGGYVQVGRAREALAIFKTVPMQNATSGDFQGAVGAALAANDRNQAEIWLRQALDRYPSDPSILSLAAQYEQARGDNERAADYYRASLAAMPKTSPVDRLAHELVHPEQDERPHRAVTAADLQRLLNPDDEPFAKTTKLPPLPSYGPDPYNGAAPVILTQPQQAPQQTPQNLPTVNTSPASSGQPSSPDSNPAVMPIPMGEAMMPRVPLVPQPVASGGTGVARLGAGVPVASGFGDGFGQSTASRQGFGSQVEIMLNPPHSMASDAWKGLVFSLMAGQHNDEALQEVNKIPPDVRRQLEADIEWVQGLASLYVAVGDTGRATDYLNRVENFYLLHRTTVPGALEIQHAWLLYNLKDDVALYPVMLRLNIRTDLTADQRKNVSTIWASWAVRRASQAMDDGNLTRGVELLQAASQDYPGDLNIRRAVAGAYARVGRAADSLALYKTIPMDDASSGDYQGAIAAAMAAGDMAQAETWLRQALARFSNDPQILGLAARFEQARGNNERATDFWRASLAQMPPGSPIQSLQTGLNLPPGAYQTPQPGDTVRLLDPRLYPLPTASTLAPLPAYKQPSASSFPAQPSTGLMGPLPQTAPQTSSQPAPQPQRWVEPPSDNPLPLPQEGNPMTAPNGQEAVPPPVPAPPVNPPIYTPPQGASRNTMPGEPVMIEQRATQEAQMHNASNTAGGQKREHAARTTNFTGTMSLPPSEEYVDSNGPEGGSEGGPGGEAAKAQNPAQPQQTPGPASHDVDLATGLRIASQPMDPMAAHAQALFADQTDSQLTEGSATFIRAVPNAPVMPDLRAGAPPPSSPPVSPTPVSPTPSSPAPSGQAQYNLAQYTPSAQEAATGAYSAPQQQPAPQPAQPAAAPPPPPKPSPAPTTRRRWRRSRRQPSQTLGNAPINGSTTVETVPVEPQQTEAPEEAPEETQPTPSNSGLTDQELEQRNLPPLRGPWVRLERQPPQLDPREVAEQQLTAIESGYSGWLGGTGTLSYRSGNLGYDHLADLESPFEASAPLGYHARITVIAKPVFLDSGQADGTAITSVLESSTAGTALTTIPEPIGTLTATSTTPPGQQNAVGIGGEVQLAFPHLTIAGGYTPYNFLVATFTARAMWRPGNGPFTFNFSRDSVKDSQLSYAGLRDPAGNTLDTLGQIWGGVMANAGNVQYTRGDAQSGFYFGAGVQYLTGYQVETNNSENALGGAYWRVLTSPEYGNLSIGANFYAMHYSNNQDAFTHGMGGYFSPQGYFLANIPFTWAAHYGTKWHYNILGAMGVQAFQENETPLWPLASDKALETGENNPMLPPLTSVGANYDLRGQVAYQVSPHWFAGGFFGANNTRNYKAASVGFFVRYMFRSQPSTVTTPTGLFPTDGLRPFTVP